MIRVLIAGEGKNELGERGAAPEGARSTGGGVVEALMEKVRATGWQVGGALTWKDVTKLKVNAGDVGERKTVKALALRANELGCNALVFLRDRDKSRTRERAIRDAIEEVRGAPSRLHQTLQIAGGVPIEKLECWLLALRKEPKRTTTRIPRSR